jgi:Amt family ammonium transporter
MIRFGATTRLIGQTPPEAAVSAMVAALRRTHGEAIVGVADAGQPKNLCENWAAIASGILLMPVANNPGDAIAWFRPEFKQTIRWGGNPSKAMNPEADGRISPRKSFAVWSEQVTGCSLPWTNVDQRAAHDLRRAITAALLQQAELQLAHLSAYDPLTGLANRRTLEAQLERWRADPGAEQAALLFVDLDRFKTINDTLGHHAGDEVLVEVASRLVRSAPAGAVPGRLGGDEFVLFWRGASEAEAERLGDSLAREFARPFVLKGQTHYAGASVGIAYSAASRLEDLMRQADAAMYASKRAGGARAVLYKPAEHASVLTNMQIEQDLFRAIENDELEVHYQPMVAVPGRGMFGFEALIRWRHPVRGWVSPAEFIPRAEEAGLIVRIGGWVMTRAVRQLAAWRVINGRLIMSINVAARQLTDGSLSDDLAELLAAERVPPENICLEVTESALMNEAAVRELHRARAIGVKIAVDDFGTGYSSLSYLKNLPVTEVKIDRSFVNSLGSDDKAELFFKAIVNLAHTIELHTVAEGVETEAQWGIVQGAGCDTVQGWLISRALDPAAATRMLEAIGPRELEISAA